jgi:ribosomal protein L12E/L44/L45/RPP1/RPP2
MYAALLAHCGSGVTEATLEAILDSVQIPFDITEMRQTTVALQTLDIEEVINRPYASVPTESEATEPEPEPEPEKPKPEPEPDNQGDMFRNLFG